jgi:hypothetical protein
VQAEKRSRLLLALCGVLLLLLCWRWQRVFYLMCADYIRSDMPAHIALALGHNDYSLASYIVRVLWALFGEARGQTLLSLVLTANQLLGVLTVCFLLRRMFPTLDTALALLAAILAHVCGPWILPGQTEMYLGVYNGNVLHNMTLLFSRTPVPLVLLFFFRLWDSRESRLRLKDWLGLALTLALSTLFKPSFLGAFAPAVLVMLIWDFIKTRAKGFKNEFLIGCAVLPSAAVLLWSSSVLFAEDFAGTSSGVALRALTLGGLLSLLVMYLRGLLLPLWSHFTQGVRENERGHLRIVWGVLGVAILEALTLTETGFRANDGNFEWGSLALYPTVFALAIALLMRLLQRTDRKKRPDAVKAAVGLVLLLGHLAVGLYCLWRPGHAGYDWFYF